MLALVIAIFVVGIGPLAAVDVPRDLPADTQQGDVAAASVTVTLNPDGTLRLGDGPDLPMDEALAKLEAIAGNSRELRIMLRADGRDTPYDRVMEVMARLQQAGFDRVALVAGDR